MNHPQGPHGNPPPGWVPYGPPPKKPLLQRIGCGGLIVLAVLGLGTCALFRRATRDANADAGVQHVAPPPAASIATSTPSASVTRVAGSFARFEDGELFECTDMTVEIVPPADAGSDWKPTEDAVDLFVKSQKKTNLSRLQKSCAAQFSDRTVLASCGIRQDADAADAGARRDAGSAAGSASVASLAMTSSFYLFSDIAKNDHRMAECLELKGDWKQLGRDTSEWRRAQLEDMNRRHHKAFDKLQESTQE